MSDDRQPDPRLVWRWAGEAFRPVLGWGLCIAGAVALTLGYLGVSREVLVAKQLPYVISGGIGGIAMVFLGGIYLGAQDVRRSTARILRLERLVDELHGVLLAHAGAPQDGGRPAAQGVPPPVTEELPPMNGAGGRIYALPSGSTYHRADCAAIGGKSATAIDDATAQRRGLNACKLCEPAASVSA